MKTKGISLVWIVVKDMKEAIKFYTEVVGLKMCEYDEEYGWAELSGPNGYLLGIAAESKECGQTAGTNAVVTIEVDDIEKASLEFTKKEVRFLDEIMEVPGHVKLRTFQDRDGNRMQLVQTLAKKGGCGCCCC